MSNHPPAEPATQNLEFVQACEARLPKAHRSALVRLDPAVYQAGIFSCREDTGKTFAIDGRLDAPTPQAIAEIPEASWKIPPRRQRNPLRRGTG